MSGNVCIERNSVNESGLLFFLTVMIVPSVAMETCIIDAPVRTEMVLTVCLS